jgi:hypothetical protein
VPIDPKHRHSKSPETEVRGRSQSRRSASPDKARRKAVRTPSPTKRPQRRTVSRARAQPMDVFPFVLELLCDPSLWPPMVVN